MSCHQHIPRDQDGIPGSPLTTKSRALEGGASMVQDFTPVKQICAHLNAFHIYASDPTRAVEANHYCTHVTEGLVSSLASARKTADLKCRPQAVSDIRFHQA
jgi:hypothetical protein